MMNTSNLDINYEIIENTITLLKDEVDNTYIAASSSTSIKVDNIDIGDIFIDSTGDSVSDLKMAFEKVGEAYKLVNSLLEAAMNMLIEVKEEYQKTDSDMAVAVDNN